VLITVLINHCKTFNFNNYKHKFEYIDMYYYYYIYIIYLYNLIIQYEITIMEIIREYLWLKYTTVRENRKRDLYNCLYHFQYISFGISQFRKTNTGNIVLILTANQSFQ